MCCHVKLGRSALKGVRINKRKPPKLVVLGLGPFGWGVADSLKIRPSPHVLPCRSRSNVTSVINEIRLKNLTPRTPPFKVTQNHRNQHGSIRHL